LRVISRHGYYRNTCIHKAAVAVAAASAAAAAAAAAAAEGGVRDSQPWPRPNRGDKSIALHLLDLNVN